ncbi:hypothetical protein [Candidatus Magnetomonas plexicatena]|uniref:hypothetical protein n=1 Tax=Candidatus Magnetomonas plexicatena TaxID=2552947 RepID=UPI001C79A76D|nr:PIN domain-containing protein [Nitrospirales bacterium LBB_01]
MRVVLDCNVIISAGLNNGTCMELIEEVVLHHQLFLSQGIVDEYHEVTSRVNTELRSKT